MRKLCAVFAVAGLVFALGASAFAATQTITGQLIDQPATRRTLGWITKCPKTRRAAPRRALRWVNL